MKITSDETQNLLTYCTNIHPGNGWQEVFENISLYAPKLKAKFAKDSSFGIGLRISDEESRQLLEGDNLLIFQKFLEENGLFVFTINGFPFGVFHRVAVKEDVYAPDWQNKERLNYTLRLAKILSKLLPKGIEGGISTLPLTYKDWVRGKESKAFEKVTGNLVLATKELIKINQKTGKLIHIDIEPEPDCLLENSQEAVDFYKNYLFKGGVERLAQLLKVSEKQAKIYLQTHIRVCYDICHMAVAFEDPEEVLKKFKRVGIRIGKIQISSALTVNFPQDPSKRKLLLKKLKPFAESVYLHQVTQQWRDGSTFQYSDLDKALLQAGDKKIKSWRIHFHVPLFAKKLGLFSSTQEETKKVLKLWQKTRFSNHLEIETYTWDVLPAQFKTDLLTSIEREYEWTIKQLRKAPSK